MDFATCKIQKFCKMIKKNKTISSSSKIFQITFYRLDQKHCNFCFHDKNFTTCLCKLKCFPENFLHTCKFSLNCFAFQKIIIQFFVLLIKKLNEFLCFIFDHKKSIFFACMVKKKSEKHYISIAFLRFCIRFVRNHEKNFIMQIFFLKNISILVEKSTIFLHLVKN